MKLKLACADYSFPILPHDQVLQIISMLGLQGVNVALFQDRSHLQPSSEFANVRRAAKRLKKRLDDNGLVAADIFLQLALDLKSRAVNHPRPQVRRKAREDFIKALDYASTCGSKHLTGLPGVLYEGERRRDCVARAEEELAWRLERANEHNIVFSIEPHIGSFADTPRRAAKLVRDVPGLTLSLDLSHFYPRGFAEDEMEELIQYSSHFHARAATRRNPQANMHQNTLNWQRIFAKMEQTGYRGWIEFEYCWSPDSPQVDNLAETVRCRDYFRKLTSSRAKSRA